MNNFLQDVLAGLQSSPKYLDSKYFYDKKGDELFQKIMGSDEYYLTNAEMEIFSKQSSSMADVILRDSNKLDVVEFGPGDAIKSIHLLQELSERKALANYFPIDISGNIIHLLDEKLPKKIPDISVHGFAGEYLDMLHSVNESSKNKKIVLFLGANIGNFKFHQTTDFCKKLRSLLSKDDLILIGFDLKKNPKKILAAYDDRGGFTRDFNLNLLARINRELGANFQLNNFEHYACYDPESGACKSYLISAKNQSVSIENSIVNFGKNEPVFMEISQKYSLKQIDEIAEECCFKVKSKFFDANEYFVDVIFEIG